VSYEPLQPIIIKNEMRPRRRSKRRKKIGPALWRIGVYLVMGGITGTFFTKTLSPYAMRIRQKHETARLESQLNQAIEENKALKRQVKRLQSGEGLELEARRLGYVRAGEIPLQVIAPPPDKAKE
jgi:cell division protein FtsB